MTTTTTIQKNEDGSFMLQEKFEYMGIPYTCKSWGNGSTANSHHIAQAIIGGVLRVASSTSRKQAKDMTKKRIKKYFKQLYGINQTTKLKEINL